MSARVVIVGAGGFGREVLDILEAREAAGSATHRFAGFLDDGEPDAGLLAARGAACLGPSTKLGELDVDYVIGVGSPVARRRIHDIAEASGRRAGTAVHPTAVLGANDEWAPGLVLCAHVSITTNVRFGWHCHVNLNATIGHDAVIGDFVTIHPGANISGNVTLESDVTIGAGATVIPGITVGAGTTVGAGAVVVRDLPPGITAVGVPAKPVPPKG